MAIEFMVAIMAVGGITLLMVLRMTVVPAKPVTQQPVPTRHEG